MQKITKKLILEEVLGGDEDDWKPDTIKVVVNSANTLVNYGAPVPIVLGALDAVCRMIRDNYGD